jgi:hypothetical protein
MNIKLIKKFVKLNHFFEQYCGIKYSSITRHKMRGKDSANKPLTFTDQEKRAIKKGWRMLNEEIYASLKE